LNKAIENVFIETPYKIPKPIILQIYGNKIRNNQYTRSTVLKSLSWFKDRRLGKAVLSKSTRTTY